MLRRMVLSLATLSLGFMLPNPAYAQTEKKALYGVLLDNSGSIERQLPQVLMVGEGVVRRIHQRGPVALFNFRIQPGETKAMVASGVGWSQNEQDLSDYLRTVSVQRQGQRSILEAIYSIASELNAKAGQERSVDRIIILITDGEHRIRAEKGQWLNGLGAEADERRKRENRLIKSLKESAVRVYAVGMVRELDDQGGGMISKSERVTAEDFLKKLTKETGGRVVFPGSKVDVDRELNELLK